MSDGFNPLRIASRELYTLMQHGCTDAHCRMRPSRGGMHTNGGCNCVSRLADLALEVAACSEVLKRHIPTDGPIMQPVVNP